MNNADKADKTKNFKIPENFFNKLYEFTGTEESNRGFFLAYVSQDGTPVIFAQTAAPIIEMGLMRAIEKYISEIDENKCFGSFVE